MFRLRRACLGRLTGWRSAKQNSAAPAADRSPPPTGSRRNFPRASPASAATTIAATRTAPATPSATARSSIAAARGVRPHIGELKPYRGVHSSGAIQSVSLVRGRTKIVPAPVRKAGVWEAAHGCDVFKVIKVDALPCAAGVFSPAGSRPIGFRSRGDAQGRAGDRSYPRDPASASLQRHTLRWTEGRGHPVPTSKLLRRSVREAATVVGISWPARKASEGICG